jgi:predicted GTPase
MSTAPRRVVIPGAAGRDANPFNPACRGDPSFQIASFIAGTAALTRVLKEGR